MERRRLLQSSTTAIGAVSAAPLAAGTAHAAVPARARGEDGEVLRIHLVTFDGVEELDVFHPFGVFSVAARAHPVTVKPVTGGEAAEVTYSFGTRVETAAWSPHDAALIVVPGGGFGRRDSPGVWAEIDKGQLPSAPRHLARSHLAERGARVVDRRVVDDGDLVTADGVSSGIDGALRLLERELEGAAAAPAEAIVEFERRGTVLRTSTAGQ
ncbi:DJ-1/PfpI family protein [Streptomyces avermitilis]